MQVIETPYNYVLTIPVVSDTGSDELLSLYCYPYKGKIIMDISLSSLQEFIYGVSCDLLCVDKLPTMAVEESEGNSKQILILPIEDGKAQIVITINDREEVVLFVNMEEIFQVHEFFDEEGEFSNNTIGLSYLLKWVFTLPTRLLGFK